MGFALNARVILASPYGCATDAMGAVIRNGSHGYVRAEMPDGHVRVAFPGVRVQGTYHRATLTVLIEDWWLREPTLQEVEHQDFPSAF